MSVQYSTHYQAPATPPEAMARLQMVLKANFLNNSSSRRVNSTLLPRLLLSASAVYAVACRPPEAFLHVTNDSDSYCVRLYIINIMLQEIRPFTLLGCRPAGGSVCWSPGL